MRRMNAQRWRKARERGMRAWVLRRGVLGWGVPMYFIVGAMQVFRNPTHWRHIALIGVPIWLGAGVLWGALIWATMERLYRRYLRKTGGA